MWIHKDTCALHPFLCLRFEAFEFRVPLSCFFPGSKQAHAINQTPLTWPNKLTLLFYLAAQLLTDIKSTAWFFFFFRLLKKPKSIPGMPFFFFFFPVCKLMKRETPEQLCDNECILIS